MEDIIVVLILIVIVTGIIWFYIIQKNREKFVLGVLIQNNVEVDATAIIRK